MKIINILENGTAINLGVWNATVSIAKYAQDEFGIRSEVWFPAAKDTLSHEYAHLVPLPSKRLAYLRSKLASESLSKEETIIVTHGSWRFPTIWGSTLKQLGFPWIYVPHGMLNPYGMSRKAWLKWPYFLALEKRLVQKADCVRAVGFREHEELKDMFGTRVPVNHVPLGVPCSGLDWSLKTRSPKYVLFMARLHPGKGVIPLVEAWMQSSLFNHRDFELIIAGPDQGDLSQLKTQLRGDRRGNIRYIGPIYGPEKEAWLAKSTFFVGPSKSETFPTTIIETMVKGMIPVVTAESNLPEIFPRQLGIRISPDVRGILVGLEQLPALSADTLDRMQQSAVTYVHERFSIKRIAGQLSDLYSCYCS